MKKVNKFEKFEKQKKHTLVLSLAFATTRRSLQTCFCEVLAADDLAVEGGVKAVAADSLVTDRDDESNDSLERAHPLPRRRHRSHRIR